MSEIRVAAIVGGQGEKETLPILFRRIAGTLDPGMIVQVKPVLPVPESLLAKAGELEKHVEFAARSVGRHGGIFILLDCDWPVVARKMMLRFGSIVLGVPGPIWRYRS